MPSPDTEVELQERLSYVLRVVRRICKPPIDCENLAAEVVLEYLGRPLRYKMIRSRCYDELRRLHRERVRLEEYSKLDRQSIPPFDDEQLGTLLLATELSSLERSVLYMTYCEGLTFAEISQINWHSVREISDAQWSALEKLKEKARVLYG